MGEGLGRRPRHAHGVGPRGAAARPHARARRRVPRRRARGRDGRRVRLLPARQGRCGAVDRHRDARAGGCRARRSPAPRLRHRVRDRRRTARSSPRRRSATRWSGCRGAGPASSSGSTSPRSRPRTPPRSAASSAATASRRGATRRRRPRRTRCGSSRPHRPTSTRTARPSPSARSGRQYAALPEEERRAKAAALAATIRGIASHDKPMVGHFTDDPRVLEFLASAKAPKLAALGTSCPDHFLRTKVKPMLLDLPSDAPLDKAIARLKELHEAYRADYTAYYEAHATRGLARDPRRRPAHRAGAGRRHVQLRREQADRPRRRRVLPQRHQRDARRRGALDVHPDLGCREVPHRVLGSRRGEAAADAEAEDPPGPHRLRHGRGIRNRQGHRDPPRRRGRLRRRRRPRPREGAGRRRRARGHGCRDRRRRERRRRRRRAGRDRRDPARVRRHRPRRQQRRALAVEAAAGDHREGLGPAARRDGEGLVPRVEGRREGAHRPGPRRRHHLHLVEELRVRRPEQHRLLGDEGRPGPPGAPARGRTRRVRRAGQRHQPRRRRPRLGHLRVGLGRQPRRDLRRRRRRTSASTTPSARSSSARSCPRTSRTPSSCSPDPSSAAPPACTSRSTPASPPRSCDDACEAPSRRSTSARPAGAS